MTKAEQDHIAKVGLNFFEDVVMTSLMRLKMNGKLRAAYKLREELAYQMALRATGFKDVKPFSLASKLNTARFGTPTQEFQTICDEYLNSVEVVE